MITFKELLGNNLISDVAINIQHNLEELLTKMNKIRTAYNKPMQITSGLRSKNDHIRIYSELAAKRGVDFDIKKVPMGSAHLTGCACDILDKDGSLMEWCKNNEKLLEEVGLWCEEKDDQPRVHFQIYPPKSGKRFFKP